MDMFESRGPLDSCVVWPRPRVTVYALNGYLFTLGSVWTGVVHGFEYGCNRPVFCLKGKTLKGRFADVVRGWILAGFTMATGTIVYIHSWYRVAMEQNIVGPWGPFCCRQELAVPDGVVAYVSWARDGCYFGFEMSNSEDWGIYIFVECGVL